MCRAYVEVLGVNVAVLSHVEVFLSHEHALAEEVLVDLLAVGLGDKPGTKLSVTTFRSSRSRGALTSLRLLDPIDD
jgi:hypothetical protein